MVMSNSRRASTGNMRRSISMPTSNLKTIDDESLCELHHTRTDDDMSSTTASTSGSRWLHGALLLCVYVCGVGTNMIFQQQKPAATSASTEDRLMMPTTIDETVHESASASAATAARRVTLESDSVPRWDEDMMMGGLEGLELTDHDREFLDNAMTNLDYDPNHEGRELTESNTFTIPESAVPDDPDADEAASLTAEDDWEEDKEAEEEEDGLNVEEDETGELEDYDEGDEDPEELETNSTLKYSFANNQTENEGRRELHAGMSMFTTEEFCPGSVDLAALTTCTSLSDLAPPAAGEPVVIPCDTCITVDTTNGDELLFPNGLVIKGKLYFPTTANVVIRSKFIFVHGLLKIDTPADGNTVKFSLYQDEKVTFVNENHMGMCSMSGCNMGSKVVAVIGGQLDIKGTEDHCTSWEKLHGVGTAIAPPFHPPTDGAGNEMELEIAGECKESYGHTKHFGKTTIYCPLKKTITVRHGTKKPLIFTNLAPLNPSAFTPPVSQGRTLSLKMQQRCRVSWGHTRFMKQCMLFCPIERTANVWWGLDRAMTFTSKKPDPVPEYTPPTNAGRTLELKVSGRCYESPHHTFHMEKYTCRCPLELTANIRSGTGMGVKFTNQDSGKSFVAKNGVHHWAWGGRNMYFFPEDKTCKEVGEMFPPGSTMTPEYLYSDGGKTIDVKGVHHWALGARYMFFRPEGYGMDDCWKAADRMNADFPVGYGVEVDYRQGVLPVAVNQTLPVSGVHHWAWGGNRMFFFPDKSAGEVNRLFPPGYRIKVGYAEKTHVQELEVRVSEEAINCWGPGTQLVLSSHTRSHDGEQVAVVESVDTTTKIVKLDRAVERPITLDDNADFAIEIGSLSRKVVFEADDDANDSEIGGHMIIFMTESYQHLEGIEVKNFGQLGRLGRYPIHFHMCGTSSNSVVKKCAVHESNQRAYVIHGTHNVWLEGNVAYKVPGHTYFLEAGTETGVTFKKNLGVNTISLPSEGVKALSAKSKRRETDDRCATFWISNPDNYFIGNVAAGSRFHGYWTETRIRTMAGPARDLSMRAFDDNEVHSCRHFAFTTYPPGWRPKETNILNNLKVYRNSGWGMFLHATRNLVFKGGVFADNGHRTVVVNRADDITFDGTTFIGQSEFADKFTAKRWWACRYGIVGLYLLPHKLFDWDTTGVINGTKLVDTKFYNWDAEATGCAFDPNHAQSGTKAMFFDTSQVFTKAFTAPHVFKNVLIDEPSKVSNKVDACKIEKNLGIENSIIHISSDDNKAFSEAGVAGFLASEKVTTMLPDNSCSFYSECLHFCPGACLRTVTVLANAAIEDGIRMKVMDPSTGKTLLVEGQLRAERTQNPWDQTRFVAALPKPSTNYDVSFIDANDQSIWPSYAVPILESCECSDKLEVGHLNFLKPPTAGCSLVKNTDFTKTIMDIDLWRKTEFERPAWWQGRMTKNTVDTMRGTPGTNALLTTGTIGTSVWRGSGVTQWIDMSCLEQGQYEITMMYRQIDKTGATVAGCTSTHDCPNLDIRTETFNRDQGRFWATYWAGANGMDIAKTDPLTYKTDNSFQTMTGIWTVTQQQFNADRIQFTIDDAANQLVIDSFVVTKLP